MMIGSIGGGGGMNFHAIQGSLTESIGKAGETGGISDLINSGQGVDAKNGMGDSSMAQPTGGLGSMLSGDTLNFLMLNSMYDSLGGGDQSASGGGEKGSISEMLALANQAYNAASNLQTNAGTGITGIEAGSGLGGGGGMGGIV
jgi:hypothetical protein